MEKFDQIKSLTGTDCFVLDATETELLHVNYLVTKIHDNKLAEIRFDGCRPIVDTDMFAVGTCKYNGKVHTVVASKENIVAALQSDSDPLISSNHEIAVAETLVATPATLDIKHDKAEQTKRLGAFSQFSQYFLG